jgi:membrane-associated protease RseP (regulator of RpoE activity)
MILLCSLLIIIVCHEIGHLFAAKWLKCDVTRFSVGFGKVLLSKKIGKTIYQLALIPLGGFCELKHELAYSRSKYAFTNLRYTQKVIISLAGIAVNCWMAVIAYWMYLLTYNEVFVIFGFYSMAIGLSNAIPFIPCLDGSYLIIFLFEKKWGKKKTYRIWGKICQGVFKWLMVLNVLSLPYLGYLICTGKIL